MDIKNIPIRLEKETYKQLKIYAIKNDLSVGRAIERLLKLVRQVDK